MKRFRFVPFILLGGSLIVLIILFAVRLFGNNNPISRADLKLTASAGLVESEVVPPNTSTASPVPSATATLEPTSTITETQTPTATDSLATESPDGCDVAGFVADVTIPDGTELEPGAKFTKTWRLKNDGTCTWTSDYKLYFYSGNKMGGPDSQRMISIPVPPGTLIEISVDLIAPEEGGKHTGYWALKNAAGIHFGIGPYKNPVYVEIKVIDPQATATDAPVFTDTPAP